MFSVKNSIKIILLASSLFYSLSLGAAAPEPASYEFIGMTVLNWPEKEFHGRSIAPKLNGNLVIEGFKNGETRIWDVETGLFRDFSCICGSCSAKLSSDEKLIISRHQDGSILTIDVETGQCKDLYSGSPAYNAKFSQDGKLIISSHEDGRILIWDAKEIRNAIKTTCNVINGPYRVFDCNKDQYMHPITPIPDGMQSFYPSYICSAKLSPDGTKIVSLDGEHWIGKHKIRIWDVETGEFREFDAVTDDSEYHNSCAYSVAFSTDGTKIVSKHNDNKCRICDVKTGLYSEFDLGPLSLLEALSPNNTLILIKRVTSFRILNVKTRLSLELGCDSCAFSAAFSPDGMLIASRHDDGKIRVWDVKTGLCHKFNNPHARDWRSAGGIVFIDNSQIAVDSGDKIVIYTDLYFKRAVEAGISGDRPWTTVFEHKE